jgi:predicted TIM-barrel fold metal-dependent hydrolase
MAGMGLVLENSMYFHQLSELADFARAVPDLTIVLNHIGGLCRIGPYAGRDDEVIPEWRRGVSEVATCPNIIMKLGGVGQLRYGFDWQDRDVAIGSEELTEGLAPLMDHCIQQFGPDRCMFESNFPVDKVSYSYNVLYNAFKRLSSGYSATERAALFHDTAARVYNINI